MIEIAIVVTRLLQYLGAAILFGSSLFFVYALAAAPTFLPAARTRRLLAAGAALLAVSSLLAVALQASLFTGSLMDGFTPEAFTSIISFMNLGKAAVVRSVLATLAFLVLLAATPGRTTWLVAGIIGGGATATLAWLGHGAASDNWLHLAADVFHALAAALWIGALVSFLLLLNNAREAVGLSQLHLTLRRFSGIGLPLVLALVLSGVVNSWYLVGPSNVAALLTSPYGRLLSLKLALFGAMLLLAALNRYRLTPALAADGGAQTVGALRRSIALEAMFGLGVLAAVAWLGTLEPPLGG